MLCRYGLLLWCSFEALNYYHTDIPSFKLGYSFWFITILTHSFYSVYLILLTCKNAPLTCKTLCCLKHQYVNRIESAAPSFFEYSWFHAVCFCSLKLVMNPSSGAIKVSLWSRCKLKQTHGHQHTYCRSLGLVALSTTWESKVENVHCCVFVFASWVEQWHY